MFRSREAELIDFDGEEAAEYWVLGVKDGRRSHPATYDLPVWPLFYCRRPKLAPDLSGMKAPQCAGVIHTDFEHGFIKACRLR